MSRRPLPSREKGALPDLPGVPPRPKALDKLNALVGLKYVKGVMHTFHARAAVAAVRARHGHPAPSCSLHAMFVGNPGTGKTTVAQLYGELLVELGLLARREKPAPPAAHTPLSSAIRATGGTLLPCAARGGVLLIDQTHPLRSPPGGREHGLGPSAVQALVKLMDEHRGEVAVVFTGYPAEMRRFVVRNPGLRSRIGRVLTFDDLTDAELVRLFHRHIAARGYRVDDAIRAPLVRVFAAERAEQGPVFGNALAAQHLAEAAINRHAARLAETGDGLGMLSDGVLSTLSEVDIAHAALDLFAGAVFVGGSWFAAADMHRVRVKSAIEQFLEHAGIAAARGGRDAAPPRRT